MLSYQHGYHAGNRADVLKHAVLDAILREVIQARAPIFYVETHSGRGVYNLQGRQSARTGEAKSGVLDLLNGKAPKPLRNWTSLVSMRGAKAYPGSPALAAARLRKTDRIALFEKHPTEYNELCGALGDDKRIQIRKADGYSGALKLQPRRGEQLICFVDPSYETSADMEALADWAPRALKRWPGAIIILWLPLFRDEREAEFGAWLGGLEDGVIAGARWHVPDTDDTALEGSAIVAYRAPEGARESAIHISQSLQSYWSAQKGGL